jgi:hypothetical protein
MNRAMSTPARRAYGSSMDIATLAGTASTALFAVANLPMIAKAIRTHDMTSYSFTALLVGNAANVIHTFYVASLPIGPIWVLHGFYFVTMAVMIALYVRHGCIRAAARARKAARALRSRRAGWIGRHGAGPITDGGHGPALACRHA